jgi:hypothetical protein
MSLPGITVSIIIDINELLMKLKEMKLLDPTRRHLYTSSGHDISAISHVLEKKRGPGDRKSWC